MKSLLYEFLDLKAQPDYSEANFGMLRWNGEPKPAYTAIKNLIALLRDPGPAFTPGTLEFSINGDVEPARHILLQKRDGRFYLLLWINAVSYETKTKQDVKFTPQPTRILFAKPMASAKTYTPLTGPDPVAIVGQTTELLLQVPDHVLVVELQPKDK